MAKTPDKLDEVIGHHLPYEIDRLAETYDLLANPNELRKSLSAATFDTIADSLIVSFCVHAKALIEFLSKSDGDSNATSAAYADDYRPWKIKHGSREHSIRGKLNNQLSHLTFGRTTNDLEKIRPDDRAFIVQKINDELMRWVPLLREEYRATVLPIDRLNASLTLKLKTSDMPSATNQTMSESIGWTGPAEPSKKNSA